VLIATVAIQGKTIAPTTLENKGEITEILKPSSLPEIPTQQELKLYLASLVNKYGLDYDLMSAVIQCESGWQIDPPHNNISWGLCQFTPPTWDDFGYGDIMNPYAQLEVMVEMWSKGLEGRWDCYDVVTKNR
jgi:hypothetical protein